MSDDEINRRDAEWRAEIRGTLHELKQSIEAISREMQLTKNGCANAVVVEKIHDRVLSIERDRSKIIGALVVVQFFGAAAIWAMNKIWK